MGPDILEKTLAIYSRKAKEALEGYGYTEEQISSGLKGGGLFSIFQPATSDGAAAVDFLWLDALRKFTGALEHLRAGRLEAAQRDCAEGQVSMQEARAAVAVDRGEKIKKAASSGGKEKAERLGHKRHSSEMQAAVDELHLEQPQWSYEEIKRQLSKRSGWPVSALKRYTKNPRRK